MRRLLAPLIFFFVLTLASCTSEKDSSADKHTPPVGFVWTQEGVNPIEGFTGFGAEGRSVAADLYGNVYTMGNFTQLIYFGRATLKDEGHNYRSCFITKHDPDGRLVWAKALHGSLEGTDMTVDKVGNLYLTGSLYTQAYFESDTIASCGNNDVFVAKLDPSGKALWARSFGSEKFDYSTGIALDGDGSCYVASVLEGEAAFSRSTVTALAPGLYITKYDADGNAIWSKQSIRGNYYGGILHHDIAVGRDKAIYTTGSFTDTISLGKVALHSADGYNSDVFVAKHDATGTLLWAKKIGAAGIDESMGIAVSTAGLVYVAGAVGSDGLPVDPVIDTLYFDGKTVINQGGDDAFIAQLDASGRLNWVSSIGGEDYDEAKGIALDTAGNAYLTGFYTEKRRQQINNRHLFVAKYDGKGKLLWEQTLTGDRGGQEGSAIALDKGGNIFIAGSIDGTTVFGNKVIRRHKNAETIFISKLSSAKQGHEDRVAKN